LFYDAIARNYDGIYGIEFLRDLIHEVVQTIKKNLKVDWTEPHREDVKAAVRAAVKRTLRNRGVQVADLEVLTTTIMAQAAVLYASWPVAA
jgi:type I restriction enzyme, R subunit